MNSRTRWIAIAALVMVSSAFAGSRDVEFRGQAGPYPVRVTIQTPGVIPGLARIRVITADTASVEQVTVQPLFWNVPPDHAPAPDQARRRSDGTYEAELWLMVSGSYGVRVSVSGTRGDGTVVVPVSAVAYERLEMPSAVGGLLLGLAIFLAAGLVTIIRSASRESTLIPRQVAGRRDNFRGAAGLAAGTVLVLVLFAAGRGWWNRVDLAYRNRLYRPPQATASLQLGDRPALRLVITDSSWSDRRKRRPLASGPRAAHVFLLSRTAFAHLHPAPSDGTVFDVSLPALPEDDYRVFMEVTDSSGFTETVSSVAHLPWISRTAGSPRIDGYWASAKQAGQCTAAEQPVCRMTGDSTVVLMGLGVETGISLRRNREPLAADWTAPEPAEMLVVPDSEAIVHFRPFGTMTEEALAHFNPGALPAPGSPDPIFPYSFHGAGRGQVWVSVATRRGRVVVPFDLARLRAPKYP